MDGLPLEVYVNIIKWRNGEIPEGETRLGRGQPNSRLFPNLLPYRRGNVERPRKRRRENSCGMDNFERDLENAIEDRLRQNDVTFHNVGEDLGLNGADETNHHLLYAADRQGLIRKVKNELLQIRNRHWKIICFEDLMVYFSICCWSSMKRLEFLSLLSDQLFRRGEELNDLHSKLERDWKEVFKGRWIDSIDDDWIRIIGSRDTPKGEDAESVKRLLRFVRNRHHHADNFKDRNGLRDTESLYNYLSRLFPDLLKVSYGAAYEFCREEDWFRDSH